MRISADVNEQVSQRFQSFRSLLVDTCAILFRRFDKQAIRSLISCECVCLFKPWVMSINESRLRRDTKYTPATAQPLESVRSATPRLPSTSSPYTHWRYTPQRQTSHPAHSAALSCRTRAPWHRPDGLDLRLRLIPGHPQHTSRGGWRGILRGCIC